MAGPITSSSMAYMREKQPFEGLRAPRWWASTHEVSKEEKRKAWQQGGVDIWSGNNGNLPLTRKKLNFDSRRGKSQGTKSHPSSLIFLQQGSSIFPFVSLNRISVHCHCLINFSQKNVMSTSVTICNQAKLCHMYSVYSVLHVLYTDIA